MTHYEVEYSPDARPQLLLLLLLKLNETHSPEKI
jgi:hypothetical protein